MKKWIKKSGLILSFALGILLIGQIAYAQTSIDYSFRLPKYGSVNTSAVTKTNKDYYADHNITYFGWSGSGVDSWLCDGDGNKISQIDSFYSTDRRRIYYINGGPQYYYNSVNAVLKTDGNTFHECDVTGRIWP